MIYKLMSAVPANQEGTSYDAEMIRSKRVSGLNIRDLDAMEDNPTTVEYVGNLTALRRLDYPHSVPTSCLLVSRRLVRVLEDVRHFPHEVFPIRVYSDALAPLLRDEVGHRTDYQVRDPSLYTDEFVILKLTAFTDCLDKDKTIVDGVPFRQTEEDFVDSNFVDHYEFVEPSGGFPLVFITPEITFYAWSEEANAACERAGLTGLLFYAVP